MLWIIQGWGFIHCFFTIKRYAIEHGRWWNYCNEDEVPMMRSYMEIGRRDFILLKIWSGLFLTKDDGVCVVIQHIISQVHTFMYIDRNNNEDDCIGKQNYLLLFAEISSWMMVIFRHFLIHIRSPAIIYTDWPWTPSTRSKWRIFIEKLIKANLSVATHKYPQKTRVLHNRKCLVDLV